MLTAFWAGLGRRLQLWAALAVAGAVALWVAYRRGRRAAAAAYAIRRADARVRAMETARDVRDETSSASDDDLRRRLDRWVRPGKAGE